MQSTPTLIGLVAASQLLGWLSVKHIFAFIVSLLLINLTLGNPLLKQIINRKKKKDESPLSKLITSISSNQNEQSKIMTSISAEMAREKDILKLVEELKAMKAEDSKLIHQWLVSIYWSLHNQHPILKGQTLNKLDSIDEHARDIYSLLSASIKTDYEEKKLTIPSTQSSEFPSDLNTIADSSEGHESTVQVEDSEGILEKADSHLLRTIKQNFGIGSNNAFFRDPNRFKPMDTKNIDSGPPQLSMASDIDSAPYLLCQDTDGQYILIPNCAIIQFQTTMKSLSMYQTIYTFEPKSFNSSVKYEMIKPAYLQKLSDNDFKILSAGIFHAC
jgi:hypothetical protein